MRQVAELTAKVPVDAVIAINGAILYVDGKAVIEHRISEKTKQMILRDFHTSGIGIEAEAENVVYTDRDEPDDGRKAIAWDFETVVPVEIHRISIRHDNPEQVMQITKEYDDLHVYANARETLFDIGAAEAGKKNGLVSLSKLFGISLCQIVTFGDDFNDVEMLKESGRGVPVSHFEKGG